MLELDSKTEIKNISNRSIILLPDSSQSAKKIAESIFGVSYTAAIILFEWKTYEGLLDKLYSLAIPLLQTSTTFGLDAKSSGKNRVSTTKLKTDLGTRLLDHFNNKLSVNLDNPDTKIRIEVRGETAWIYSKKYPGLDGFPQGSQRSVVFGLLKPWYALD